MSVRKFVLASASPARLRTLRAAGIEPDVRVSGVDEEAITAPNPLALVEALALAKAEAVAATVTDALVLGCDSMLDFDGEAFGKPADEAEARARWKAMAGRHGVLLTGHALLDVQDNRIVTRAVGVASTEVTFGAPTPDELDAYLASGEPLRVAGAFTIDGLGGWWIDEIRGDPGTVIGLSLPLLRRLLADTGTSPTALWSPR
jgi:septum formation protein